MARRTPCAAPVALDIASEKPDNGTLCRAGPRVGGGGPATVDPGDLTFLAVDTRTPYIIEFDAADGNKLARYVLRWINPQG